MPQDYSACFPNGTPPTLYTSTGTTTAFTIGFPYQKTSDVVVYTGTADPVNWVITPTTDYSITGNPAQVVFTTAPGSDVLIMRRTELCDERIDFQAGQSIRAQDLNTNFQQQLFLTQELYEYLSAQVGGGPLVPGTELTQDFLEPSQVLGGNGIDTVVAGQNVTINQEQIAGVAGTYTSANITVDNMGRITSAISGGGGGGGLTVIADVAALNAAFAATPVGDVVQVADTTNIDTAAVPAIAFLPAAGTIQGGYGPTVRCNLVRTATEWTFINLVFPNTDVRYVNTGGDTMTGFLTLNADPTDAMHAATRQFVLANASAPPGDGALTLTGGTNLTAVVTGGAFTANKATATTVTFNVDDAFVLNTGDTMTGNLVMNTANITGDSNAITASDWDLNNGNFWTLGAITVPTPTNMTEGISGLIVNTAAATWPAAGGATFQYAGNTPPNITEFPATIPFYCVSATEIFIGTPTVNIT